MLSEGPFPGVLPGVQSFTRSGARDLMLSEGPCPLHQDSSRSGAADLNLRKGT